MWCLYIIKCADKTLYAGITTNLKRRIAEHNHSPLGAKYTRGRRPVKLVYSKKFKNKPSATLLNRDKKNGNNKNKVVLGKSLAAKAEAKIKKLSRKEKLKLCRH